MHIEFMHNWDANGSNNVVYSDGRKLSQREIYVILDKMDRSDVWCSEKEMNSVASLLECLKEDVKVDVKKGAHGDKYQRAFGLHLTVVIASGCHTGKTYHLYGEIKDNSSWEVDFITLYNPNINYSTEPAIKVNFAKPKAPVIVIESSPIPYSTKAAMGI